MATISGISSTTAIGTMSPVQSIVALIILFISTAICLYTNGYILMGILYVLIYIGAIAMLFLFMLSLLDIEYTHTPGMHPLIMTFLFMCFIPLDTSYDSLYIIESYSYIYNELYNVGLQLYTEYAMPMIMVSIILVLSVLGAIAIAK
uniref:NADH-ubiquinone oxidoreductase chain 6 n=1 Tax=Candida bohioensis TaxID=561986 RepID=U3MF26_9ASCO|nr:NADH dehydrogenase subunit 6 [Candida bohioensis]AGW07358.1 NADH dehydrogenase subunit 6 [Candida bohioensis]